MKKQFSTMKATCIAMAVIAVIFISGCAIPTAEQKAAPTTTLSTVEQDAIEKNGESRLGSWELIDGSIPAGRDIGAYYMVYVISEDGKTIYQNLPGDRNFTPIVFDESNFDYYPADKIGVGSSYTIDRSRTFTGCAIKAKYGTAHAYILDSGKKKLVSLPSIGYKATITDIAVNHEGTIFVSVYSHVGYYVSKFNWTEWKWNKVKSESFPHEILALDVGYESPGGYIDTFLGLNILAADKNVYDVLQGWGTSEYKVLAKKSATPTKDIAADPREDLPHLGRYFTGSFAAFENNTPNVHYVNPHTNTQVNLGSCKRITICMNGYLWDAYTGGIWRREL